MSGKVDTEAQQALATAAQNTSIPTPDPDPEPDGVP